MPETGRLVASACAERNAISSRGERGRSMFVQGFALTMPNRTPRFIALRNTRRGCVARATP